MLWPGIVAGACDGIYLLTYCPYKQMLENFDSQNILPYYLVLTEIWTESLW
jgi:hypothetical protein